MNSNRPTGLSTLLQSARPLHRLQCTVEDLREVTYDRERANLANLEIWVDENLNLRSICLYMSMMARPTPDTCPSCDAQCHYHQSHKKQPRELGHRPT